MTRRIKTRIAFPKGCTVTVRSPLRATVSSSPTSNSAEETVATSSDLPDGGTRERERSTKLLASALVTRGALALDAEDPLLVRRQGAPRLWADELNDLETRRACDL